MVGLLAEVVGGESHFHASETLKGIPAGVQAEFPASSCLPQAEVMGTSMWVSLSGMEAARGAGPSWGWDLTVRFFGSQVDAWELPLPFGRSIRSLFVLCLGVEGVSLCGEVDEEATERFTLDRIGQRMHGGSRTVTERRLLGHGECHVADGRRKGSGS